MMIVLDSNEYIFYLNKKSSELEKILFNDKFTIYVHDMIIIEVLRNISETLRKKFYQLLFNKNIHLYKDLFPKELISKYAEKGLKKGDVVIAALCESVEAHYLISENRHFLKSVNLQFQVSNLKDFIESIK